MGPRAAYVSKDQAETSVVFELIGSRYFAFKRPNPLLREASAAIVTRIRMVSGRVHQSGTRLPPPLPIPPIAADWCNRVLSLDTEAAARANSPSKTLYTNRRYHHFFTKAGTDDRNIKEPELRIGASRFHGRQALPLIPVWPGWRKSHERNNFGGLTGPPHPRFFQASVFR